MPRVCTICAHPERKKIEAAIARGESNRRIANQFQVGCGAVGRHQSHIVDFLQRAEIRQELATVATVKEVLETLTWQMRSDLTDLFGDDGQFSIPDIKQRGLGKMLKSLTFRREVTGPNDDPIPVDVVKVEAHSQQAAATSLLNAYTKLEIAKHFAGDGGAADNRKWAEEQLESLQRELRLTREAVMELAKTEAPTIVKWLM